MQDTAELRRVVGRIVAETPVLDMHTHLFPPAFGPLMLWGIDELLTYHYLVAEVFRVAPLPYERFWGLSKREQADYIWKHLFVERSPVSEACRGVLTVLRALDIDPGTRSLAAVREYFARLTAEEYIDRVFATANVRAVVMTNDPFDDVERPVWEGHHDVDPRFQTALRIDPLLNSFESAAGRLRAWGYRVSGDLMHRDVEEISRFLLDWVGRLRPRYLAVSLPPEFMFPEDSTRGVILERCVLPVAREAGIPFAMMIGVRRQVNPALRLAGDGEGRACVAAVDALCRRFPENRFLVTMLSRENQHELAVSTRKHPNLMLFGCWWFMNNPSLIDELTRMRMELLGLSFVPQHSDARVLDQLIYKWAHSRALIAEVLADKYIDLAAAGWNVTEADIRRDVGDLLANNFDRFAKRGS
ncbi:MAG: glucuronate isomerase [Phycisphaerae bacterium]|jgi:hypothetical protein